MNSECVRLQFWVELPTPRAERDYRQFLANYAADRPQVLAELVILVVKE